jgi:hypothetical protein
VWECDVRDLDDVRRNGDVAFVPVRSIPADAQLLDGWIVLANSHRVEGALRVRWLHDDEIEVYTTRAAQIVHTKRQHPTAKVKVGWWRVQVARREQRWAFARPTAD